MGIKAPLEIDGRTMDPLMRLLSEVHAMQPAIESFGVENGREVYEQMAAALDCPFAKGVTKQDRTITLDSDLEGPRDINIRVYKKSQPFTSQRPVMVFYHGGGLVIGSIHSTDRFCALLADVLDHVVVSVEYRLTPEHPFPAPAYDAIDAFTWVQQNAGHLGGDPENVYTCGDSAGGQLSAIVAQQTVLLNRPQPKIQVMIYPLVDAHFRGESHQTMGEGFLLTRGLLHWCREKFCPNPENRDQVLLSPFYGDAELLAKLPPAVLTTAGFDLLRDDGAAYAKKLEAAGNDITHIEFSSLPHGYVTMTGLVPAAKMAILETAGQIERKLANL